MYPAATCRRCGEKITFRPKPGIRQPDERQSFWPVNLDDHKPHFARCKLNQALAKERREAAESALKASSQSSSDAAPQERRSLTEGQKSEVPQQGEMFTC